MTQQVQKIDRLIPLPSLQPLSIAELSDLDAHIIRRAVASEEIDNVRNDLQNADTAKSPRNRNDRLKLNVQMFEAGIISEKEHFFYRCHLAEEVDFEGQRDGQYQSAFAEVTSKMDKIEKDYGLPENQYWLKVDAPPEWLALSDEYDKIAQQKFQEVLLELGFTDLLELYGSDRNEYDRLREAGRRSFFNAEDTELAVIGLVLEYEGQASRAARGRAYFAAGIMLCAAVEARLLLNALTHFDTAMSVAASIRTGGLRSRKISAEPLRWSFDELLEVSHAAGWIDTIETENAECSIYGWLHSLRNLRNYIHPGNNVRKNPHILPEKEAYDEALQAYSGLRLALSKLDKAEGT